VELKLILEMDGAKHLSEAGKERDHVRDDFLARQGYRVVRISGYEILRDANQVVQLIEQQVEKRLLEP
jgi:very-short-patch-repair endonuclease